MKKEKIIDITSFKIAFVLWTIINISQWNNAILSAGRIFNIFLAKISLLIFMYFITYNIRRLYINRKIKKNKREIIIASVFFIISFSVLLLTWPGIWTWDDIFVAEYATSYNFLAWQHFFSGLSDIISLQILPFVSGIIIIRILVASMIVGYSISNVVELLKIKQKKNIIIISLLLFIPCILPPVINLLLTGFRMGIYDFIELLLIMKLYIDYQKKEQVDNKELIYVSLLTIIIACWRTEAIYYVIAFFIILLLYGRKIISYKKVFISSLCVIICVIGITKYNNYLIGNDNYSITATIMPVTELVKAADPEEDREMLEKINKVIDISKIYIYPEKTGEQQFWDGITKDNYTNEDYSDYLKGYLSLSIKYPKVAFNSMFDIFIDSTGLGVSNGYSNLRVQDDGEAIYEGLSAESWGRINSMLKMPFNKELRSTIIRCLANKDTDNKVTFLYYFNWNLLIPLTLLLVSIIVLLIKKEWVLTFLGLTIIGRVALIFLTSSAPYFMYYISVYLVGYVFSISIFCKLFYDRKKNINSKIK